MRLVDDEQRRLGDRELVEHVRVGELLGREEDELERVLGQLGQRGVALGGPHRRVELRRPAGGPRSRRSSTCSRWSAMSGETTTVAPGVSRPAIW